MSKETTLATFKIDPITWDSFKVWATTQGTNAAESLRYLIRECLAGRVEVPTGGESNHQAIAGIDERIDTKLDEQIAALEFRLDGRTSERLEPVWAQLADLKAQIQEWQKMPPSESPVAGEGEPVGTSLPASVSNSTMLSRAAELGWRKGCGQSAGKFMEDRGWKRLGGLSNKARWSVG